jgi:sulfofructose kinase
MPSPKLLGIGHIVLDHSLRLESLPGADIKVEALQGTLAGGGPVPTACVTAARLGATVGLLAQVGDDPPGDFLVKELESEGLSTEWLKRRSKQRTPMASIMVTSQGQRTVILDRAEMPPLLPEDLDALPFQGAKLLLLDGKEPIALAAAQRMREAGGEVMLDLGGPREDPVPLIEASDILVASRTFLMHHFPEMEMLEGASMLHKMGPRLVVITIGAGGAIVCPSSGQATWFPGWSPGRIVDSTGAGDIYHGTLAWALLEGWDDAKALAAAAIAGGMACRALGGRGAIPTKESLIEALEAWTWPSL